MPPFLAPTPAFCFAALMLTAAFRDVVSFTIPNWIPLAVAALFPVAALVGGLALPTAGLHLAVGFAALVAGMAMFALGWIGGGDAKLLAAVTLWLGWPASLTFVLATALVGGGLAVALLTVRSGPLRPVVLLGPRWLVRLSDPGEGAPYGVAIAAGALMALPLSPLAGGLAL